MFIYLSFVWIGKMAITINYSSPKMWKRYLQKEAANTTEKSNRPVLYITCNCLLFLENTLIVFVLCKIYRDKTIEVGVYIDRHLYKNMEEVFLFIHMHNADLIADA